MNELKRYFKIFWCALLSTNSTKPGGTKETDWQSHQASNILHLNSKLSQTTISSPTIISVILTIRLSGWFPFYAVINMLSSLQTGSVGCFGINFMLQKLFLDTSLREDNRKYHLLARILEHYNQTNQQTCSQPTSTKLINKKPSVNPLVHSLDRSVFQLSIINLRN